MENTLRILRKLKAMTLIEWLIVIATVAILVALLLPPVKWASSGTFELVVRLYVFDAVTGKPIVGARAGIREGPAMIDSPGQDEEFHLRLMEKDSEFLAAETDIRGIVSLQHEFRSGASYQHPKASAWLPGAWIFLTAQGYGGVLIPVSDDSREVERIRARNGIFIPMGLVPTQGQKTVE